MKCGSCKESVVNGSTLYGPKVFNPDRTIHVCKRLQTERLQWREVDLSSLPQEVLDGYLDRRDQEPVQFRRKSNHE